MHKLIEASVIAAIGVLVFASLLIPVVDDATAETETHYNNGVFRMTDVNDPYVITYDPAGQAFIINDKTIPFSVIPAGRWTIVSTDAFMFRFQAYAAEDYGLYISDTTSTNAIASTQTSEARTWTFDNGTYTGYDGVSTRTYTAESFRGFEQNGAYIMTNGTDKPIVNGDSSIIIGHGLTVVNAQNTPFYIYGTVDDGVTINTKNTVTVSNIEVNATAYSSLIGCYTLNSITFTAEAGGNSVNATYDRVIVPYEITAEKSVHADANTADVLAVLPLILICALIMGVLGYAVYTRIE